MPKSATGKKASAAQRAQYAPKPKPLPAPPKPKPVEKHRVVDDTLKKIVQRVLEELKLPAKIPSEVIFAALAEVRDLVERAAAATPLAKPRSPR